MRELEFAALDSVKSLLKRKAAHFTPESGAKCANCETELTGLYCHACGQAADNHHRSLLHLIMEGIEGLFHFDGRLWRTLPPLFFRPGLLARDYMNGRLARHVPPFRTFLVSLLLFIFAAESLIHHMGETGDQAAPKAAHGKPQTQDSSKQTPIKARLTEAAAMRDERKSEAAKERDDDLKSAHSQDERAEILKTYTGEIKKADDKYTAVANNPDATGTHNVNMSSLMHMTPEERHAIAQNVQNDKEIKGLGVIRVMMIKAFDNPRLFILSMFAWGHRLAVLLLPIMTLSLAALYAYRRKFFFFDHFLVACNLLSFMFLTNALGFILPDFMRGWWALLLIFWTPVYIFNTLRGAYGSGIFGAGLKTLILWTTTTISFGVLLLCLAWVAASSM